MSLDSQSPELDAVNRKLRELMNEYADALATGSAHSFDEYQHSVGIIQGLALAERIVLDIISKVVSAED